MALDCKYTWSTAEGKPDYFTLFAKRRVDVNKLVSYPELCRRTAYELQIPAKLATRVYRSVVKVISDALLHGECVDIPFVGRFHVQKTDVSRKPTVIFKIHEPGNIELNKNLKEMYG